MSTGNRKHCLPLLIEQLLDVVYRTACCRYLVSPRQIGSTPLYRGLLASSLNKRASPIIKVIGPLYGVLSFSLPKLSYISVTGHCTQHRRRTQLRRPWQETVLRIFGITCWKLIVNYAIQASIHHDNAVVTEIAEIPVLTEEDHRIKLWKVWKVELVSIL